RALPVLRIPVRWEGLGALWIAGHGPRGGGHFAGHTAKTAIAQDDMHGAGMRPLNQVRVTPLVSRVDLEPARTRNSLVGRPSKGGGGRKVAAESGVHRPKR